MILSVVMSGLGNQLYQYANGRAIAQRLKTDLYLDIRWFEDKGIFGDESSVDNVYYLDKLNISAKTYTIQGSEDKKIAKYFRIKKPSYKNRFLAKTIFNGHYFFEYYGDITKYDPNFPNIIDNSYIACCSQSYKNFFHILHTIRDEFSLKIKITNESKKLLQTILKSKNAVSIHFRRGDKVYNPSVAKIHGSLSLQYYYNALNVLKKLGTSDMDLFIFSDDIEWVKRNFTTQFKHHYIDFNNKQEDAIYDLELMKHCKYHIIANSTFSLWGAMLAKNTQKVIAPNFCVKQMDFNLKDIYPPTWIVLGEGIS